MSDVPADEIRNLQLDYLLSARETVQMMKEHAESLGSRRQFKTAFPVLLYLTHQLKGSGGTLGFGRISELAAQMAGELNRFLDDAAPRPDPGELSSSIVGITTELGNVIDSAERELRATALVDGT
jgi:chemotaxis protein histidine kinase CheA